MGRQISVGNPPILVDLRVSTRAKRLSLRVSRLDGKVSLTMPKYSRESEAIAFLEDRTDWLQKHVGDIAPAVRPAIGGQILVGGAETPIVPSNVKRAALKQGQILVPAQGGQTATRVKALLKLKARDALAEMSDYYANELGQSYTRLSIRDTRSRWGSCSTDGVLMYSWRLIMAPIDVLNYVAAHEVAHLVEMNHSQAFWDVVASLMPDYPVHRRWLKENGDQLHRYDFTD